MREIEILERMNACRPAIAWLAMQNSYEDAWQNCHRGDWMLWNLYRNLDGSDAAHRKFTLAKAQCAETVFHLMKDERSRNAVAVAKKYGIGEASIEDLRIANVAAAYAADDADAAADDADAAYAVVAAAAAADAAYAAVAAADAGDAAAAAAAAADAGDAAAAAADAADAAAAAADAAADDAEKKENQMQCANIIRVLYPNPPALA